MTFKGGMRSWALAVTLAVCAVIPSAADAGTITPTDGADEYGTNAAHCSLRESITAAMGNGTFDGCSIGSDSNNDTIQLQPGVTYDLSIPGVEDANASGDLDVVGVAGDDTLTIDAPGTDRAVIDAHGATTGDRVLDIGPGLYPIAYVVSFTLHNVEVTGGDPGDLADSGGIRVFDVTAFNMSSSYVHGNSAGAAGGLRLDSGNATITDSRIEENTAAEGFAGVWVEATDLTMSGTTIANNHAFGGGGGGLVIGTNAFPDVTVTNSSIYGNEATEDGAGIYSTADPNAGNPGSLTIASSTISGNIADSDGNGSGDGGGLFTASPATSNARNSIFANNDAADGPDCAGSLISQGYNLIEDPTGCTVALNLDVTGVDPKLGPAAIDPGGVAVPVLPLLPGSLALNAANPATPGNPGPACPNADQRAFSRSPVFSGPCDIGAFEYQGLDTDGDKYPDDADNCTAVSNPTQTDTDGDDFGDACDPDIDGDGLDNGEETVGGCPVGTSQALADSDGDGAGDAADAFPCNAGETADTDHDGVGDNSDACPAVAGSGSDGCVRTPPPPPLGGPEPTGLRGAALRKCKKKKKPAARKKCKKKATKLPL